MARSILSFGMFSARAAKTAARSRAFMPGSGGPNFAATVISRASLGNSLGGIASCLPFLCMMFLNWLCPDIPSGLQCGPARLEAKRFPPSPRRARETYDVDISRQFQEIKKPERLVAASGGWNNLFHTCRCLREQDLARLLIAGDWCRIDLGRDGIGAPRRGPRTYRVKPTLQMQKIVELLALVFVRDNPRIGRHVGDRIIPRHNGAVGSTSIEEAIKPVGL